jgi:hypothetical protein
MLSPLLPLRPDRSLARSALPHAPVVASFDVRRSSGTARRHVADALRATADRLAPEPWPAA